MIDFRAAADARLEQMIAVRRDFHQHPELSFQEVRTAGIVSETLRGLGLEVQTGVGKTGVVAVLEGDHDGPTVLVRCDMDALPIDEGNAVAYRSTNSNVMHACGHDGHTSVALAVAAMLTEQRHRIAGRVKFMFQPAEEIGQGALAMLDAGLLSDPAPDVTLGLHLWNELPVGEVAITPGPIMASCERFDVTLTGKGGHGALPHQTIDPVMTLGYVLTSIQSIVSRNVPPEDVAVISATQVHAGHAFNVIPQEAHLTGTMRTFRKEIRDMVTERFKTVVRSVAQSTGCEAEVTVQNLSLPVVNNAEVSGRVKAAFQQTAADLRYTETFRTMAAEDFAYVLDRVPGMYFLVGSANAERGLTYPHHHPRFDFDEQAMAIGARLLATAVAAYVLPG